MKLPWLEHFQLIGEYINLRKQNFTETNQVGAFLTRDIFDSTASRDSSIMASALIGALWPNGAQSIQFMPARGMKDLPLLIVPLSKRRSDSVQPK